jgi:hypothetical protein
LNVLDSSNVNQWWRNREDVQWVVFEYLKLEERKGEEKKRNTRKK